MDQYMKIYKLIILLICAFHLQNYAQEASSNESINTNKAIIFTFDEFRLGSLKNGIGGKYFFNDKIALLAIINAGMSESNRDVIGMPENNTKSYMADIEIGFEDHLYLIKNISSPYWGLSFSYNYTYSHYKYQSTDERTGHTNRYLATIFFGVEFFPIKNLSISGRYLLNNEWYYSKSNNQESSSTHSGKNILISASSLLLSFYF